ncbi:hypothetical protein [Paenibacillus oryzisoli]|uniref:Uncharacterized protein n=1 Tax=Paenibacillus oryzisoli TaxID=1850517 RepID=A0A197ZY34_9BACL|nr:hypothetical protein [Paenibacillus oryzisoli]OAS13737.1 hypothetical protein A8708_25180 [Paenibacillus oryzisoli]
MQKLKAFYKANNFPIVTFGKYWRYSSISELIIDFFLPMLISILLLWFTSFSVDKLSTLIEKFQQVSGQVIASISILAGFNIASITILSTIIGGPTGVLRSIRTSDGAMNLYDILICFFTWAVIIQLIVVFLSIILFYIGSFIPQNLKEWQISWWAWVLAGSWLTITIHSVLLSIRNMKTLFLYVTYKEPNNSNSGNN